MKKAVARKSFRDDASGRVLARGNEVRGDNARLKELEAAGLVERVEDVSEAENEAEEQELGRATMLAAVVDEGTGARVSIGFDTPRQANYFREQMAAAKKHALEGGPAFVDPADAGAEKAPGRQAKPGKGDRRTKPAPAPTTKPTRDPAVGDGGPGAGGGGEGGGSDSPPAADAAAPPPEGENDPAKAAATTTPAERPRRGNQPDA